MRRIKLLTIALLMLALCPTLISAEPTSNDNGHSGVLLAGPDISPYSRDRKKGDIVGQPPVKQAPANNTRPNTTSPPPTSTTTPPPVSTTTPPPQPPVRPPVPVAGSLPLQELFDSGRLEPTWVGQGRVAGEMVELTLKNNTDAPFVVDLEPGMVLELEDEVLAQEFQPIMLEETSTILVPANSSVSKLLRGYCLDYDLEPPSKGRAFDYRFPADAVAWSPAINVLKASLTYDSQKKVLPVEHQRTVVIQRSIWVALGQTDKEKLYQDILQDAADAGKTISKKKARRLADTLWEEVERLVKLAQ
ncbi:MAG: hypothetical protein KC800_17555 [Candidatus Eremiobacteraeota bacterium]|nr:hypothetical protein [Candidatus Eremiobacteraeota bacterium]